MTQHQKTKIIRVLLIEDNPGDARLFREMLVETRRIPFDLEWVDRLSTGLKRLDDGDIDCVLLDLSLPDTQGLDTFATTHAKAPQVPIIVLTGLDDERVALEAVRMGAQDFLVKEEVDGNLLLHAIRYAVERMRAEKALRKSEEKFRLAFENAGDAIFWADPETGLITKCNKAAETLLDKNRDEIIGQCQTTIHPPDKTEYYAKIFKKHIKTKGAVDQEAEVITKYGKIIPVRVTASVTMVGEKLLIQGIFRDISERKQAEEELRKINQELENFVHVVSHDLKTSIITVQGFSARLLKNYQEKLGKRGRLYLEQIKTSAYRMETFVFNLLALSRAGLTVSAFKNASSLEIVKKVTSDLGDRLKENGTELIVADNLPTIYCDGERIYQVFQNLLVNAIKYMGDAKSPAIEIGYQDKGDLHQFYVRDNGIGIDPKYHKKIFETFRRLKETKDQEGTGLGLAIIEKIINSHGGKVWVESEKGKGATFYFTLKKSS
ncbi:MAG: PAS domain S-box protein [Desulfobulbaceae bacterium]|nr:PAS domain S-box protein [Desulfobulbaceae bacterium]